MLEPYIHNNSPVGLIYECDEFTSVNQKYFDSEILTIYIKSMCGDYCIIDNIYDNSLLQDLLSKSEFTNTKPVYYIKYCDAG